MPSPLAVRLLLCNGWTSATDITQSVQAIADGSGPTSNLVGGVVTNYAGGNANGVFEKSDLGSQWILQDFREQESTMDQLQLKASWDNGGAMRANFGLGYYDNEIAQNNLSTREELGGWNTGFIGDIVTLMGEDAIEEVCISCQFNDNDNLILSEQQLIADYTAAGGILAPGASFRVVGENAFFVDPLAFAQAFDGFTSGGGAVYDINNRKVNGTNDRTINESMSCRFTARLSWKAKSATCRCRSWSGCATRKRTSSPHRCSRSQ